MTMQTKTTTELARQIGLSVWEAQVGGPILATTRDLGVAVFLSGADWAVIQALIAEHPDADHLNYLRVMPADAEIICGNSSEISGVDLLGIAQANEKMARGGQ